MTKQVDFKKEGITSFATPPAPTYRYAVELKSGKLSIWMEDRESKKQWYKGDLSEADYTSSENTIPSAKPSDYAKCFHDELSGDLDDPSNMQRKLRVVKDDGLCLTFAMPTKILRFTWSMKYTFDLAPISVERIDVLESILQDQREEIAKLQEDLNEVKANQAGAYVRLQASSKADSLKLRWDKIDSDNFAVNGEDGIVKICQPGIYIIQAFVQSAPNNYTQQVQVLRNNECMQVHHCIYVGGAHCSTPLGLTTYLDEDDEVTVTCEIEIAASSLSIARDGS